ncbi:MAG: hypothetical protein ABFD49_02980 [Armatimonadota bacterium]|nr:hypothetical protein [bacterium]
MEENNLNPRPRGCAWLLRGCAVVVGIAFAGLMALLIYVSRMHTVQDIAKCRDNMIAIGAALDRYNDVNGKYPEQLVDLKRDYLKKPSVLRCPVDKSAGCDTSYIYHRPKPDSQDDFVVLECNRHRLRKDVPLTKLLLHKDGNITVAYAEPGKRGG